MHAQEWPERIIKFGFYLLFGLVPLLLTPWNYELFEYNKMMAVYAITIVIGAAWITKMIAKREIRIAKTPLDIPLALFVLSQFISTLFSIDPHVSWFGYYSRFNGGMWSILSYVTLYYAFVSNDLNTLKTIKGALGTATIVALYGIAERFGVDKHIWVQDVQNRVFSTLGQPNWLAAYLVALLPIAWSLALMALDAKPKRTPAAILYTTLGILFFVVLLFTRSRSGLLAFALIDMIFVLGTLLPAATRARTGARLIVLHAVCAIILFVNGTNIPILDRYLSLSGVLQNKRTPVVEETVAPGPALENGGTESGTIRKFVWEGAVNAWKSTTKTMLFGTGTETFAFAFYQFRPQAHNLTSEWDFLYNKAHNEYLNYLATTGAFGFGSYLFLLGTWVFWFGKTKLQELKKHTTPHGILELAIWSGWISLLITNFFGFSVVVAQVFLFLFPAMLIRAQSFRSRTFTLPPISTAIVAVGAFAWILRLSFLWYADTRFALGYRQNRTGQFEKARLALQSALAIQPAEPLYHDEMATALASLSVAAFEAKNATESARLAEEALIQSDAAIRQAPANVNFWKTRTKVYYGLAAFDPTLNTAAIESLERARILSPNDPKIYYNLAILRGRQGENNEAITYLFKAKALKPNYKDAYYGLYIFYTELKKPQDATAIIQEYLNTVDANDREFQTLIQ